MAATPPATSVVETPPTPRHGDTSRHYPTRKSARQSSTKFISRTQTPPRDPGDLNSRFGSSRLQQSSSPASSGIPPHSPPSSTNTSPRGNLSRGRKTKYNDIMNGTDDSRDAVSSNQPKGGGNTDLQPLEVNPHMLPTPASAPRKKQVSRPQVDAAARVLFPPRPDSVEDAMPTPRKNRKNRRNVGFNLYGDPEEDGQNLDERVQVFTDSKDRVPEVGPQTDNPFVDGSQQNQQPEMAKPRASRKRKQRHVETNPQIEDAFNRDEGIVYTFRGRKIYRKFPQSSDSESGSSLHAHDDANAPETTRLRPFTRSSVKPRLLFPTPQQQAERSAAELADEEATTEIEDNGIAQKKAVTTPVKKSFQTVTPPTTVHRTRSTKNPGEYATTSPPDQDMDDASQEMPKRKKVSPFDGWARTKPGAGDMRGKKREGEAMEKTDGDGGKRVRSGASASTSFG
ncbi:uncharacterized protein KY384_000697 [Bacidia gigantensis]|uniref:uncharacterized protein n=1 Tax=Bacidia gigantensis TaxID=2732470 RepID=UPI001D04AA57|nr:uncharacterized protein KY384_000697 [Bacidia gigantensis]KAG8525935.1 hypothetical protein KY384_000697 [Bacidia gigantensis]